MSLKICAALIALASPAFALAMPVVAIADYCPTNGNTLAKSSMVEAIEKAGFAVTVVPFSTDDARLEAALRGADALMVGGGIGKLQDYPRRREFELRMIRLALARNLPVAGVCHGSQIINVYFGGTLTPTPADAAPRIVHKLPPPKRVTDNYHLATVAPGTRIAKVLGSGEVRINSSHTMRSEEIGKGLKVTARAADGVVEAFEHETLPVMGFQFHPERMTDDPKFVELLRVALSPVNGK